VTGGWREAGEADGATNGALPICAPRAVSLFMSPIMQSVLLSLLIEAEALEKPPSSVLQAPYSEARIQYSEL
jgi:hypothetical protein